MRNYLGQILRANEYLSIDDELIKGLLEKQRSLRFHQRAHLARYGQPHKIGELFISHGYCASGHVLDALSIQLGIPIVDLREINFRKVPQLMSPQACEYWDLIPLGTNAKGERVVGVRNFDQIKLDLIAKNIGFRFAVMLITPEDFRTAKKLIYGI